MNNFSIAVDSKSGKSVKLSSAGTTLTFVKTATGNVRNTAMQGKRLPKHVFINMRNEAKDLLGVNKKADNKKTGNEKQLSLL